MNNTYLFIDGTNLYSAQFDLFGPNRYLNFSSFIKIIENILKTKFDKIFFYASYTPNRPDFSLREKQFAINEFRFYQSVKLTNNLIFFKGYRSKTSGKEKEVDVKLAVDLVGFGLLNKFNKAYVFTGDADFLQAIFFLKKFRPNKQIELLCLCNRIMYKGLFYLPSHVLNFGNKPLKKKGVAKKAKIINIKKTADLCPRLG